MKKIYGLYVLLFALALFQHNVMQATDPKLEFFKDPKFITLIVAATAFGGLAMWDKEINQKIKNFGLHGQWMTNDEYEDYLDSLPEPEEVEVDDADNS